MKNARSGALALLTIALAVPGLLQAITTFGSAEPETTLTFVHVTLGANGSVTYNLTGECVINGQTFRFSSTSRYDPATKRAAEKLSQEGGGQIQSTSSCSVDPWQNDVVCSNGLVSAKGYDPNAQTYITSLNVPLSAKTLRSSDRDQIKAEYQKALDAKNAANRKQGATHFSRVGVSAGAAGKLGGAVAPPPPSYGAAYAPGAPPALVRVGQTFTIPVVVTNRGSAAWPAGSTVQLGHHWIVSGVVSDGPSTPLPSLVLVGGSTSVNASVKAPAQSGRWTIRWDVFQSGVGYYSTKGVPTKDQQVTISP